MKAVCLLGSPRTKGNSATLANHFMQAMQQAGVETKSFALNNLTYRGCQACYLCKTKADHCVLEDDLNPVLEAVMQTDILVMATPVYFGNVSSQLKTFFDRTFSFLVPDYHVASYKSRLAPGKKSVFIMCQGNPDENRFTDVFPNLEFFLQWFGFAENHLIRACGVRDQGEVRGHDAFFRQIEDVARQVLQR
ncbi:MAG: flavodoxin family protein [Proteobacteria bacterium]|nr:flavodoxin family protein [Pseudomonadota bacterium]MBU4295594.1 flavodoxin family protein [Pseudomonadota bacterium]MCG2747350.1 flavodoxin family protein [Desulfobulbaceae bacterium]